MEEGRLPKWLETVAAADQEPGLSPESPIRSLWPAILSLVDRATADRCAAVVLQNGDWPDEDLVVIRARDLGRLKKRKRIE